MALPEKSQIYYPRCKARLIIRLEDFSKGQVPLERKVRPTTMLHGTKDVQSVDRLAVGPDPAAPPGVRRLLLRSAESILAIERSLTGPQTRDTDPSGMTHVLGAIVPRHATWGQNGIRAADTLSLQLEYVAAPINPLIVRSCAVEFFLGCVTQEEHALGVAGAMRGDEPVNMIADTYLDENRVQRSNLRFQGFVDKWDNDFSDSAAASIKIECRDNTQIFIETDAPGNVRVAKDKAIDEAIADYLANFRQFDGVSIEYRPVGETPPMLKDALSVDDYSKLGPAPSKAGGSSEKLKVWDYLTDVAGSIGHSIRIDGTTVILQTLSNLLTDTRKRADDPFRARNGAEYRQFIYGRNVRAMTLSHSLAGKATTQNVEVRSYQTHRKKTLVSRFPLKKDRTTFDLPGDTSGQGETKWNVQEVKSNLAQATIDEIAKAIYFSNGKNELTVTVKTVALASFGGDNLDPDVLDMKTGDVFELLTARSDEGEHTVGVVEQNIAAPEVAKRYLRELGFAGAFADAVAKAYTDSSFQVQYRVKGMTADWDIESGVAITLNGANFMEVRLDPKFKDLPPTPPVVRAPTKGAQTANYVTAPAASNAPKRLEPGTKVKGRTVAADGHTLLDSDGNPVGEI